jgi:hypothetical protein
LQMISNCSTFDGKTVHFSVAIYNDMELEYVDFTLD